MCYNCLRNDSGGMREMQKILEHMGMNHDSRNASYIKHKLSDILFIVMCGVLSELECVHTY